DYTYNIRGWLKTINNPSSLGNDLFAFKLNYNTQDHGATTLFNGNISETEWRTANSDNSLKWYTYGYDALNRITYATDNLNRYALSSTTKPVSYDKNGNITSLLRKGHKVTNPLASNNGHFGTIDDLTYVYDSGNKLLKVTDAISLSSTVKGQFNDGNTSGNDYTYDANGNLIKDLNKGISSISYNHLNLPDAVNVTANKGDGTGTISYIYDATGIKLEKSVPGEVTQYAGNYTYKKVNNTTTLEFFNQSEGYVEKAGSRYKYVYQYKDHLGNVRLSYQDKNGDGDIDVTTNINTNEIVEEKNYYPFGLEHKGYNNGQSTEFNYKQFQGQEFTNDLGLNWHEWKYRISDPAIGRFISVDPLAEGYVYNGVYNFAENRVIDGNELEGLEWENFMSKFKDPKDLKVKRPSSNAQRQSYKVNTSNNSKTFKEVKSIFLNNPQDLLTNSKAEFNSPVDGNGNETSFQEGSFIEIDIDGPSNNAYVKVENITDTENNVSASFVTMEGHIEKGEISFSIKVNEDGTMSFSIESKSEVDQGIARTFAENFSRTEQKESWKEVLNNFVEITGGEEKDKNINVDN
ncbi:RHS repeat-associated protein, partial [Leeuwenhoekiella aestuarii]|uniref:DUF1990 family protein n=1 Tax=Leeuwenhoekiella aestuarii TaxID=2249426 RepID=UPI000FFED9CA